MQLKPSTHIVLIAALGLSQVSMAAQSYREHLGATGAIYTQSGEPFLNTTALASKIHLHYQPEFDSAQKAAMAKMKLTKAQKAQAKEWQLSDHEEKQYLMIMNDKRLGFYYQEKHLTPVNILGINAAAAGNYQQAMKMANLQQAQIMQRHGAELAYGHYQVIAQNMATKGIPALNNFNLSPWSPIKHEKHITLQSGDTVVLYTKLGLNVAATVGTVLESIKKNSGIHLDVYFVGIPTPLSTQSEKALVAWAQYHQITPDMVGNNRPVMISPEPGRFFQQRDPKDQLPLVLLVRDGKSMVVKNERLS